MRGMRNSKRKTTDEKAREILAQGLSVSCPVAATTGFPMGCRCPMPYRETPSTFIAPCKGKNWIILPVTIGVLYRCDLSGKLPGSAYLSI